MSFFWDEFVGFLVIVGHFGTDVLKSFSEQLDS